jgi:hypothetical protein
MELIKKTRLKIGKAILAKKLARTKRKVHYSDISEVKKIGIVWDASKSREFTSLSRFHQKMSEKNIEVKIFGYFPGKNLPDQYTAIRFLTCIKDDEINFFYHPVSSESTIFIQQRFDVLIDINFEKLFPLYYISSLSNAGFKVGLLESGDTNSPFDLMMEIKSPVDVNTYLDQILQYLEMINAETVKSVKKQ